MVCHKLHTPKVVSHLPSLPTCVYFAQYQMARTETGTPQEQLQLKGGYRGAADWERKLLKGSPKRLLSNRQI